MLDTNSIGMAMSVDELLYGDKKNPKDNSSLFDEGYWTVSENKYPVLNWMSADLIDPKLVPEIIEDLDNSTILQNKAYIITDSEFNKNNLQLNNNDVYFKIK